jgi:hypothetical protein
MCEAASFAERGAGVWKSIAIAAMNGSASTRKAVITTGV